MSTESMRSRCAPGRLRPGKRAFAAWLGVVWLLACGTLASADNGSRPDSDSNRAPTHLVFVRLTADGLRPLLSERVEQELDVHEEILGTQITGRARVVGKPDVQLVASEERITLHLRLEGTAVSRTRAEKGAAVMQGRSKTAFSATRPIVFEPGKGFRGLETVVAADTQFVTEGVGTARSLEKERGTTRGVVGRVIQRRAAQRLQESRPQTAEIARDRAERRIRQAVERRIDAKLARLNWIFRTKASLLGDGEPLLACCTTRECVLIGLNGGQAASEEWPDVPAGSADAPLEFWLHRTLFTGPDAAKTATISNSDVASQSVPHRTGTLLMQRALNAFLAIVADQSGLAVRYHGDWLVIEFGRRPTDDIRLAQAPAETELR